MTKSKKKIILSLMIFAFVVLTAVAVVSIAFSLTQQTITSSNLSIEYIAEDIDGSVYATYKIGSGEEKYLVPTAISGELDSEHKDGNSLLFKAADTNNAGRLEFPESDQNIALKSNEDLIIKYTYSNTGDKHYIATMSFDYALTYENMNVEYSTDGIAYATERYALVVPSGTTEMSYWIKISIEDKTKDASLNGNFNWLLKGCDDSTEEYRSLTALEFKGNNGSYSASLSGAGGQDGKIVFPSEINGDPVTTIVSSNMSSEEKLKVKEIVIPDSVTVIGTGAFSGFSNITEIDLPNSIENLGVNSFYNSSKLQSVKLGKNVSSIGSWSFAATPNLEVIEVDPENTTYYSENNCLIRNGSNGERILEAGCKTSIIPNDVTEIVSYAFILCTNLTEISIPASVTKIGDNNPFRGCKNLTLTVDANNPNYYMENNCLMETETKMLIFGIKTSTIPTDTKIIGNNAFNAISDITSINLPEGVKSVGVSAFQSCTNLSSVSLPSTLETIGTMAFSSTSLSKITIPSGVTNIEGNPFISCTYLENITVEDGNTNYYDKDGCLIETATKTLKSRTKDVNSIPSGVEIIGINAFAYCKTLTVITIPESITKIQSNAFVNCTKLTSVTFENTNGWFVTSSETSTSRTNLSPTALADAETAAKYLSSVYVSKYWHTV